MARNNNNEQNYDNLCNEGGEGYNPHRDAMPQNLTDQKSAWTIHNDRRIAMEAAQRVIDDGANKPDQMLAEARETIRMGKEQIAREQAESDAKFMAIWTREITIARREAWNDIVRSWDPTQPVTTAMRLDLVAQCGHEFDELKRAIKLHTL